MNSVLEQVKALHRPGRKTMFGKQAFVWPAQRFCEECDQVWPCRTAKLLDNNN